MIVTVSELSYQYHSHKVLDRVSFSADIGLTVVLGPNGAGKSTLFRCILGLLSDYSGSICFDLQNNAQLTHRQRASIAAYVPQLHQSAFGYSVFDVVLMGASGRLAPFSVPGKREQQAAEETLARLELTHLSNRNFSTLSGGEQQLVLIARALAQRASVLIMDEPTANLDYGNRLQVLQKIRQLARQGYTVLLSTHEPQNALTYADQVLALRKGAVVAHGSPHEVLTPMLLQELYGVSTRMEGGLIVPQENSL